METELGKELAVIVLICVLALGLGWSAFIQSIPDSVRSKKKKRKNLFYE